MAVTADGQTVVVADTEHLAVRTISTTTGMVSTLLADPLPAMSFGYTALAFAPTGNQMLMANGSRLNRYDPTTQQFTPIAYQRGNIFGAFLDAQFQNISDVAYAPNGQFALVLDKQNQTLRRVDFGTRLITDVAGGQWGTQDGTGAAARFGNPDAVAISPDRLVRADR